MDGCWVDVEGPGDFADGPAFLHQGEGEGLLIRAQLLRSSERHAATLGGFAALVGAVPDERPFEQRITPSANCTNARLDPCVIFLSFRSEARGIF